MNPGSLFLQQSMFPRHSMSVVYAYIDPSNHPAVGKYGSLECLGLVWSMLKEEMIGKDWTSSILRSDGRAL